MVWVTKCLNLFAQSWTIWVCITLALFLSLEVGVRVTDHKQITWNLGSRQNIQINSGQNKCDSVDLMSFGSKSRHGIHQQLCLRVRVLVGLWNSALLIRMSGVRIWVCMFVWYINRLHMFVCISHSNFHRFITTVKTTYTHVWNEPKKKVKIKLSVWNTALQIHYTMDKHHSLMT